MGHTVQALRCVWEKAVVADAVELGFESDAVQPDADGFEIDGTVNGFLQAGGQPLLVSAADTGHLESIHGLRRSSLACRALGKVLLPLGFGNSVGEKLTRLLRRSLISNANDLLSRGIVADGILSRLQRNYDIGKGHRVALVLQNHDIDGTSENTSDSLQLLRSAQRRTQIDRDDFLYTHLAYHTGRKIIDQATIGEQVAVAFNGSEDAGNRHGGAQGLGQ